MIISEGKMIISFSLTKIAWGPTVKIFSPMKLNIYSIFTKRPQRA
jgi:hypothetical protein